MSNMSLYVTTTTAIRCDHYTPNERQPLHYIHQIHHIFTNATIFQKSNLIDRILNAFVHTHLYELCARNFDSRDIISAR